tara:strand:+ start:741 stop:1211 length:471 start_codon:yes stop_codon:yes gene_type:complete
MKFLICLSKYALLTIIISTVAVNADEQTVDKQPSLYDRLGGVYSIATVVDDFIERLLVNEVLNANPAVDAARHTVPKAGLKYQVTALVAQATGGPEQYRGQSMKESHHHLNITETEWQAMMTDFYKTLKKFKVPQQEQAELVRILEGTKSDIVVSN